MSRLFKKTTNAVFNFITSQDQRNSPRFVQPHVLSRPPDGVVGPVHGDVQEVHQLDHDAANVLVTAHAKRPVDLDET